VTEPGIDPWFVLRTRSHHENTVEIGLREKQISAYLPRYRVASRGKDRRALVGMPLFPGYVFVRPRVDQYEDIRYIRGSCGFVLTGSKPAPMPEQDLESVKVLVASGAALAVNPQLIPGQRVVVVAGPFMGVQGELVRFQSEQRLVVNAVLLGSSVSVEVDTGNIVAL
jgi:transcription antitermination factor NusG